MFLLSHNCQFQQHREGKREEGGREGGREEEREGGKKREGGREGGREEKGREIILTHNSCHVVALTDEGIPDQLNRLSCSKSKQQ